MKKEVIVVNDIDQLLDLIMNTPDDTVIEIDLGEEVIDESDKTI